MGKIYLLLQPSLNKLSLLDVSFSVVHSVLVRNRYQKFLSGQGNKTLPGHWLVFLRRGYNNLVHCTDVGELDAVDTWLLIMQSLLSRKLDPSFDPWWFATSLKFTATYLGCDNAYRSKWCTTRIDSNL
ncbi:hypothetical protein CEXT_760611 [Caerostris extrusa]|uniref:Uncharacterized protein n=1 Tax=Caerostris extrusa TaxID=172846 RepID=A0AAV4UGE8_CAEEX|nr:hypothetical protein CEXT_760611 [Caerostris extrusa]